MTFDVTAVLRHASALQRATTLDDVVHATHEAIIAVTRYRHSWLSLVDASEPEFLRFVSAEGGDEPRRLVELARMPRAGDALIEEIERSHRPVVVLDALTDARTNKAISGPAGNRTIVIVPMPARQGMAGYLATGTFDAEGVLEPTPLELEALSVYAVHLGAALERLHLLDEQQRELEERHALERRLQALQRVELYAMLASGVGHDLNNCLAVISSNLRSLDVQSLSADDREALQDTMQATTRAIDVVTNLRKLGKSRPEPREDIDLSALVDDTLALVRSSIPRSVTVVHEPGRTPMVAGDRDQLQHALASLFIQARDAVNGTGLIRVHVDEQELDAAFAAQHAWALPGRYARVVVHDTGPALSPETLARLADPHYLKLALTGTDLGLAVISRVVQQHGGLFSCDSIVSEGTRFALYLPLHEEADDAPKA